MELGDLEVYKMAREISKDAWRVYKRMSVMDKKTMGDQFIRAVDSVGANIAEGFGRFHYLDRNKFNYNARGSLSEAAHWLDILKDRGIMDGKICGDLDRKMKNLSVKLNNFISSTKKLGR